MSLALCNFKTKGQNMICEKNKRAWCYFFNNWTIFLCWFACRLWNIYFTIIRWPHVWWPLCRAPSPTPWSNVSRSVVKAMWPRINQWQSLFSWVEVWEYNNDSSSPRTFPNQTNGATYPLIFAQHLVCYITEHPLKRIWHRRQKKATPSDILDGVMLMIKKGTLRAIAVRFVFEVFGRSLPHYLTCIAGMIWGL